MNNKPSPSGRGPAVSIILPAYNAEKYIGAAVDSILSQTFTDFELIAIDDCSTDRTLEILRGKADARLKIITNARNLGIPKIRNIGIAAARGRYIAQQDADDLSLPARLQKQFDYMESHAEVAVLGTGRQTIAENGKIKIQTPPIKSPTLADMLKRNEIVGASVMIRKEYMDEAGGYDVFFAQAEDYDLCLRLAKKYPIANLSDSLYAIRKNTSSMTRQSQKTIEALTLYRLLARNRATDAVDEKTFAEIKSNGIESYYDRLSKQDKVFFHQRVAKRCMNYARNAEAMRHYRRLLKLQGGGGASFKVVGNMLRLACRLRMVKTA